MKCKAITKSQWSHATERSNKLFREADKLDSIAFDLLGDLASSPKAAQRFYDSKEAANAKFVEAREAWAEAKIELTEPTVMPSKKRSSQ